jgi:hypothetical protein
MRPVLRMLSTTATLLAFVFLLSAAGWAQTDEPSLGDLSRQQKEKKDKKVLSEDDVAKGGTADSASSSSTDQADKDKGEKKDADAAGAEAAQPADPKATLAALKADQVGSQKTVDALQVRLDKETDPKMRDIYERSIEHVKQHMAELDQQVPEAEQKVAEANAASDQQEQAGGKPAEPPAPSEQQAEPPK